MDTYQPIYDAVRSRLSNCDVGAAVQEVLRNCDFSPYAAMCAASIQQVAGEYERPCAVFRPKIMQDGDQWCALYGDDLQEGVAGFGDSPATAMRAFDEAWLTKIANHTGEGRG